MESIEFVFKVFCVFLGIILLAVVTRFIIGVFAAVCGYALLIEGIGMNSDAGGVAVVLGVALLVGGIICIVSFIKDWFFGTL